MPSDDQEECGHEYVLGGVAYGCERAPHPIDGYGPAFRHAAAIDAGLAEGTDEGDGHGPATLVTWGEDGQGEGQDWEIDWGTVEDYASPGPSQPSARHAGTDRLAEIADRAEDPAIVAQADLRYLMRRLASLGVICAKHKDDRMGMLVDVTRDGLAHIGRSPGIKTAYGTLMHAREDYGTAHLRSNRHDAELEERTWAAVVQASQEVAAALQDLPEADPRALRGLPGECFFCR